MLPPDPGVFPFREFSHVAAEQSNSVIFALYAKLRLIYCNPAWDRFASENGGKGFSAAEVCGHSLLDYIEGPLREYYENAYREVLGKGVVWEHLYDCPSAARFRKFAMRVLRMRASTGILVVNSLRVERPHDLPGHAPLIETYRDRYGQVVMCSNCRRTLRMEHDEEFWDWVPAFLIDPPFPISHGLCGPCIESCDR